MATSKKELSESWRLTLQNVKSGAERIQATADALPPELTTLTKQDAEILFARHAAAVADHTVAVNCLAHLILDAGL